VGCHHNDGTEGRRSLALSWLGILDTTPAHRRPQLPEHGVQAPIDVKLGGKAHELPDFARRQPVFEAEFEQEPITGLKPGEHASQSPAQFFGSKVGLWVPLGGGVRDPRHVELLREQIHQSAAGRVRFPIR